jgi:hypothetical protein
MLAEIFVLQLETRMRAAKEVIEEKKEWLSPLLHGALPSIPKNEPVETRKA